METYTKLFASITDSTIWAEDNETRIVWVTMLAMADRHGYVGASVPGLAARARVSVDAVLVALEKFTSPDKHSRSQEHEGRRVEVADRGWNLLNYERFRNMRDEESRREYERTRKRAQRRAKGHVPSVPVVRDILPASAQAQAQAQAQAPESESAGAPARAETPTPEQPAPSPESTEATAVLAAARDLWPALAPAACGAVARRIADAIAHEPTAARCGVTARTATEEGVVQARAYLAAHPVATPEQCLAEVERTVVRYILGDCRSGKRKPAPVAGSPPRRTGYAADNDGIDIDYERARRKAYEADPLKDFR